MSEKGFQVRVKYDWVLKAQLQKKQKKKRAAKETAFGFPEESQISWR